MRLGDLDALKEMLIKERDAIPLTKTERYSFGAGLPNPHGMSMRGGINKAFKCMEKVPTIDAVPVVRCKDCKHWKPSGSEAGCCFEDMEPIGGCRWVNFCRKASDFCSYGEKRCDDAI